MNESLEARQKANKADKEYQEKGKKYKENPDLAKQEKEKANEIFTSKKSPEELKKIKLIIDEVKILKSDENNIGKTQDEIYEMAEKIVKEESENSKPSEKNIKIEKPVENIEAPESMKPTISKTSKKVQNILENPEEKTEKEFERLSYDDINNPEYSIINNLVKGNKLSTETKEVIKLTLETGGILNQSFINNSISNSIDKEKIQNSIKLIPSNKESIPTKNLSNFKEDFPDLLDIAINGINSKSIKKGEEPKPSEILAYKEIAENYIKIGDNPEDKSINYSTAIMTASANILKEDTIIDRDNISFKEALNKIHGENIEKQFEGLTKLIEIKEEENTQNGAIANKLKTKPKLKEKLELELDKLELELDKLKKVGTEQAKKRISKIQKEKDEIEALLKEKPRGGEVMGGSNFDKNSSGVKKNPKNK